ncbi:MAG: hypothetical protein EOP34_04840 [Rickettsiales bacterium]|nr:MAG: hypothetical protein EOP34_04840 [Rickettsiales bacterium]
MSLGLPYNLFLFSKTFPYFTMNSDLRVLWTYDVWEPNYNRFEQLVRDSKINLLLLSSLQATEYFKNLNLPDCEVYWVPESINPNDYRIKPWKERNTHILSFGRSYKDYHEKIVEGCKLHNINYQYEKRKDRKDVATRRVKPSSLQFSTWESFLNGLADAQMCICFPKTLTHPEQVGNVSTLTLRYLQAMASRCLLIGSAPLDLQHLLNYNPVIEIDWSNPIEQVKNILKNSHHYQDLIEKNYETVCTRFHSKNTIAVIDQLISEQLLKSQPKKYINTVST